LAECRKLRGCDVGHAKITAGYDLRARHVIHTVGPVWRGGSAKEAQLLASCYRASLRVAVDHGLRSIAFPAISTGAYRFPPERACKIAVAETHRFLLADATMEQVIFISFDAETEALYRRELGRD
jgi:O-acetyl-ADP-ribose deacetylase (regulator of RNase III)